MIYLMPFRSQDLAAWRARITKLGNASRAVQRKINTIIPEKVYAAVTAAVHPSR
jgi:hypothetical protein